MSLAINNNNNNNCQKWLILDPKKLVQANKNEILQILIVLISYNYLRTPSLIIIQTETLKNKLGPRTEPRPFH